MYAMKWLQVYLDTGRYYCRYKGTTDNEFLNNVTSTYLFASDPNNLFDYSSNNKTVLVHVPQYQVCQLWRNSVAQLVVCVLVDWKAQIPAQDYDFDRSEFEFWLSISIFLNNNRCY